MPTGWNADRQFWSGWTECQSTTYRMPNVPNANQYRILLVLIGFDNVGSIAIATHQLSTSVDSTRHDLDYFLVSFVVNYGLNGNS